MTPEHEAQDMSTQDTLDQLVDAEMNAYYEGEYMDHSTAKARLLDFGRAAIAAQVPKAACMDQFCACRGGPAASCEEGAREAELESLRSSLEFYKKRCDLLQQWQSKMRDPERTIVCDILANGQTLPESTGRYATPGLHLEVTQIDVALYDCAQMQSELDAKPQMPLAQYGQCETCGVFSDSAKALHDAKRNCGDSKGGI